MAFIAQSEPHVAYAAYIHGFKHKYSNVMRIIPDIVSSLEPLDKAVDYFLGELQGREFSSLERSIFSLPVKLGGLGIKIPSKISDIHYANSRSVTSQMTNQILAQSHVNTIDLNMLKESKQRVISEKVSCQKTILDNIINQLSPDNKNYLI